MGGRGYHGDVKGYLNSDRRTSEYGKISEISTAKIDFIYDKIARRNPAAPLFSNSESKIYALLDKRGQSIKSITIYDKNHEQAYSIHLDHDHEGRNPHVHTGVYKGRNEIPYSKKHKKIVSFVTNKFNQWRKKLW